MTLKQWTILLFVAIASGSLGGVIAHSFEKTTTNNHAVDMHLTANRTSSRDGSIIEAKQIILRDTNSKGYASICFDNGEPVMQFYDEKGKLKGSMGIKYTEAFLRFERTDGSITSISPNDESPGWHFLMLKSLGKGKGVYMSMLTSDDFSIYQSGLGSVAAGKLKSGLGFQVLDKSDAVVAKMP